MRQKTLADLSYQVEIIKALRAPDLSISLLLIAQQAGSGDPWIAAVLPRLHAENSRNSGLRRSPGAGAYMQSAALSSAQFRALFP